VSDVYAERCVTATVLLAGVRDATRADCERWCVCACSFVRQHSAHTGLLHCARPTRPTRACLTLRPLRRPSTRSLVRFARACQRRRRRRNQMQQLLRPHHPQSRNESLSPLPHNARRSQFDSFGAFQIMFILHCFVACVASFIISIKKARDRTHW
jgi:hypothetical protein